MQKQQTAIKTKVQNLKKKFSLDWCCSFYYNESIFVFSSAEHVFKRVFCKKVKKDIDLPSLQTMQGKPWQAVVIDSNAYLLGKASSAMTRIQLPSLQVRSDSENPLFLPRISHGMVHCTRRNTIIVYGGRCYADTASYDFKFDDAIWEYDIGLQKWSKIITKNTIPARYGHAMVYSAPRDSLLIIGGYVNADEYDIDKHMYEFSFRSNTWYPLEQHPFTQESMENDLHACAMNDSYAVAVGIPKQGTFTLHHHTIGKPFHLINLETLHMQPLAIKEEVGVYCSIVALQKGFAILHYHDLCMVDLLNLPKSNFQFASSLWSNHGKFCDLFFT